MIDNQQVATPTDVRALIELSRQREQQNDLPNALALANEAWQLAHQNDLTALDLTAELLQQLAQIHLRRQDFAKLEEFSQPLLEVARQLNDEAREAWALLNVGIVRSVESDYQTAMTLFVESLEKSERARFRLNVAHCLINIGNVYANLFNYEDAFDRYQTALNDYADVLNVPTRIAINLNIGNLCHTAEQYELALEYFEKGIEIARETDQTDRLAHAYALVSRTQLALKNIEAAAEAARQAADWTPTSRQINLLNLAEIGFLTADTEGSAEHALRGIAAARRVKDDASELRGFALLARIFEKIEDFKRALRCQKIYSSKQADYLRTQRIMHALDLEIRYSLREKQRKIEALTKENSYQALLLEQSGQIAQQNAQLRQANEELQQFAYITSHDLKEPIRMIGSFSQIVQQQFVSKIGNEAELHFRYINEGVTRMNALLDALLQYATIGKTELDHEMIDIQQVVRVARENLQLKIEETAANVLCGTLPKVVSVRSLLIQLFQNLISNALKFRHADSRPVILINAEDRADHWLFSVEDNGIGIADEQKERIFVIFQRLHKRAEYEGTGIGLAICQKIVGQLGGRIWVESMLGKGATFFFTLPKIQ